MHKNRLLLLAGIGALLVAAVAGCKVTTGEDMNATVNCKGEKDGIGCEIAQTKGTGEAKVCWDVKLTCKNGTIVSGSGCGQVSNGGKATHLIPNSALENDEKCDSADNMAVLNMKITKS
jgi:hypothetical protein